MVNSTGHPQIRIYVIKINLNDYPIVKTLHTDADMQLSIVENKVEGNRKCLMLIERRSLLERKNQEKWTQEAQNLDKQIRKICEEFQDHQQHLLKIYDYGVEEHAYPVIIYDFAEGTLLSQILMQPYQQVDTQRATRYIATIARVLEDLHNRDIYLNISPANILVGKNQHIYLLPFKNHVWWSFPAELHHFLAPENFAGQVNPQLGSPADQYALAIMLCQLLSGEVPFPAKEAEIVGPLHNNNAPILSKRIPAWLHPVLLTALAKKPQERFVDMEAFAKALTQHPQKLRRTRAQSVTSTFAALLHPTTQITRREFLQGGATVVALMTTIMVAVVTIFFHREPSPIDRIHPTPSQSPEKNATAESTITPVLQFSAFYNYEHIETVNVAVLSPDGQFSASGDNAGIIQFHDITKKILTHTYDEQHMHKIIGLAWYPKVTDDLYIASIADDGWLRICNIEGTTIATKKFSGDDFTLAWTSDGSQLLVSVDQMTYGYADPIHYQFSQLIASYETHTDTITNIATTSGNPQLFATSSWDRTVTLSKIMNHPHGKSQPLLTFPHPQGVSSTSLSADAKLLASACEDGQIRIFYADYQQPDSGSIHKIISKEGSSMNAVAWRPDSRYLTMGGTDNYVYVVDRNGQPVFSNQLDGSIQSVTWSSDGLYLVAGGTGRKVQIWQIAGQSV